MPCMFVCMSQYAGKKETEQRSINNATQCKGAYETHLLLNCYKICILCSNFDGHLYWINRSVANKCSNRQEFNPMSEYSLIFSSSSSFFSILNYFFFSSCVLILFFFVYLFFYALVASPLYLVRWLCEDAWIFFHLVSNHFIACATFAIFAHGVHILRFVEQIESISFGVVKIVCLAGIRVILWWKSVQYLHLHCASKRKRRPKYDSSG